MEQKLSRYILPSVVSMVLVGTYTNIDGFFIGNVTGDDGLAAINIVWPLVAFITSLGTGIGVGGSVLLNTLRGQGDRTGARQVRSTMLFLLTTVGILTGLVLLPLSTPLLRLMGASGAVLTYAMAYARIVCLGAVFQILGAGLVALLRNEGKTVFSMVCCIVGLAVHLVLDMVLVETFTLAGVAWSTVLSQAVIMVMALVALRNREEKVPMTKSWILPVLRYTGSPLGINFVPSLVLLWTNWFAMEIGGTAGVSAYAVMSYAVYTLDYIYQGVCDGVQPIVSFCAGSGDKVGEKRAMGAAMWILAGFTALFIVLTPALIAVMPKLFAVSAEAEAMMRMGFILYAFAYPCKAAVKCICSYYYAVGRNRISAVLIYLDPLVATPLFLVVLAQVWGMNGIWLAMAASQAVLAGLGILSLRLSKKRAQTNGIGENF